MTEEHFIIPIFYTDCTTRNWQSQIIYISLLPTCGAIENMEPVMDIFVADVVLFSPTVLNLRTLVLLWFIKVSQRD